MAQLNGLVTSPPAVTRRSRFTVELPTGVDRKLDKLVTATGYSKTDVIREAVKLYYEMSELVREDYAVGATKIDEHGTKIIVRIPLDIIGDRDAA